MPDSSLARPIAGIKLTSAGTSCALLFLLLAGIAPFAAAAPPSSAPLFVGLRRSSYGLRKQNGDDAWRVSRAVRFATNFPGAQPLIHCQSRPVRTGLS